MRKIAIKIFIVIATIAIIAILINSNKNLKQENSRLKSNQEILLAENSITHANVLKYKLSDSLNAVKLSALELKLSEYKKYREQDLKLIEQLKVNKSDLQNVITAQSETINSLSTRLRDTAIVNSADTIKYFNYTSKWTDVSGLINLSRDSVDIQIKNRESLKAVETVKYKRFLGFLWKTGKVKSRNLDIISENPNTNIVNCEYIYIPK